MYIVRSYERRTGRQALFGTSHNPERRALKGAFGPEALRQTLPSRTFPGIRRQLGPPLHKGRRKGLLDTPRQHRTAARWLDTVSTAVLHPPLRCVLIHRCAMIASNGATHLHSRLARFRDRIRSQRDHNQNAAQPATAIHMIGESHGTPGLKSSFMRKTPGGPAAQQMRNPPGGGPPAARERYYTHELYNHI